MADVSIPAAGGDSADDHALAFDMRGFIENSLLEWENHVASVVVAGGCNLRCPFCHSWRYVTGLKDLERLDPEQVFSLLERQRGWIDGVVFTGGEPTLQPGLPELIRRTRDYGVKIKLHTNGSRPDVVERLLEEELLDCLAMDYKAPLDSRFFTASDVPEDTELLEAVKRTFRLASESSIDREYHTTLAPKYVDLPTFLEMAAALEPEGTWFLQQFENGDCLSPALSGTSRYDNAMLDAFEAAARQIHDKVILKRGKSGS